MRQTPHSRKPGTSPPVFNGYIAFDGYILLAVLFVLVIVILLRITMRLPDASLSDLFQTLLLLAALMSVAVTAWRGIVTADHPLPARAAAASAALGSFCCGLLAILFVEDANTDLSFIFLALCASVAALAILGLVILLARDEEVEAYDEEPGQQVSQRQPATTAGSLSPPVSSSSHVPVPAVQRAQKPMPYNAGQQAVDEQAFSAAAPLDMLAAETSTMLPPLFEDDPLYAIPRPSKAHLLMQIKSNDISVNGEDACAVSPDETLFALCDGVGTSYFSRPWATLLAQQWVTRPLEAYDAEAMEIWLYEPRMRWQHWVLDTWLPTINQRNQNLGHKTFSRQEAEEFVKMGAAATFLGVMLDKNNATWHATALGDTCLFCFSHQASHSLNVKCFPLQKAADFTDQPPSIPSTTRANISLLASRMQHRSGTYQPGDVLLLATDALAMWLFKQLEQQTLSLEQMLQLSQEEFAHFVNQQRLKKQMNDDDTTLLIVPL